MLERKIPWVKKSSGQMVGKTSKKGWRNIKLSDELANLSNKEHMKELSARVDTLFTEDARGGSKGVSKEIEKAVKLQNSKGKTAVSPSEAILLQRRLLSAAKGPVKRRTNQKKALCDVWGENPKASKLKLLPSTVLRRESLAPAVIPANPALSVNPTEEKLNALILAEAAKELESMKPSKPKIQPETTVSTEDVTNPVESPKDESIAEPSSTERKTRAQKLKEKRHKQMLKEHEQRRKEKEARRALHDKAARLEAEAEQAARRGQRLKTKVRRVIQEATGTMTIRRGAGGRLGIMKESVPTEIATSLRRIVPAGNPVLERRASLLKRRMIEQVPEINAEYKEKVRFAKLNAGKTRKLLDSDTKERCVLLG
jgi:hypothetical protein